MQLLEHAQLWFFQYYGVDWAVALTVFVGLFLIGDKKIAGFWVGMLSASLAFIFSFQIGSVANGVTAAVLFTLYLRGFLKWRAMEREGNPATG
jgi:hypothetical protein